MADEFGSDEDEDNRQATFLHQNCLRKALPCHVGRQGSVRLPGAEQTVVHQESQHTRWHCFAAVKAVLSQLTHVLLMPSWLQI
jgi:hypothetical protein